MRRPASFRIAARQLDSVEYEVAQEKAAALRRSGERLDRGLLALREFDAVAVGHLTPLERERERSKLVAAAAEALWYYVVQREACGFRDTEPMMRELGIPRDVQLQMGVRPRRSP